MTKHLIWLHEEALRTTHPVFNAAPQGTKAIFIWDDGYFRSSNYSLKRLVFIYETLCELPVDLILGDTLRTIKDLAPTRLYIPSSNNPRMVAMIDRLRPITTIDVVKDDEFVQIPDTADMKRFFKYWSMAEKTAFIKDGGLNA